MQDQRQRHGRPASAASRRCWWVVGLAIAALVVVVLAPLASSDPDGLERVAEDQGFLEPTPQDALYSIIPDYTVPGHRRQPSRRSSPGLIGVAIVFGADGRCSGGSSPGASA